jgi:hypothetical protein
MITGRKGIRNRKGSQTKLRIEIKEILMGKKREIKKKE